MELEEGRSPVSRVLHGDRKFNPPSFRDPPMRCETELSLRIIIRVRVAWLTRVFPRKSAELHRSHLRALFNLSTSLGGSPPSLPPLDTPPTPDEANFLDQNDITKCVASQKKHRVGSIPSILAWSGDFSFADRVAHSAEADRFAKIPSLSLHPLNPVLRTCLHHRH